MGLGSVASCSASHVDVFDATHSSTMRFREVLLCFPRPILYPHVQCNNSAIVPKTLVIEFSRENIIAFGIFGSSQFNNQVDLNIGF